MMQRALRNGNDEEELTDAKKVGWRGNGPKQDKAEAANKPKPESDVTRMAEAGWLQNASRVRQHWDQM